MSAASTAVGGDAEGPSPLPPPQLGSHEYAVRSRQERFRGGIFSLVSDEVAMPDGGTATRDTLRHPGAVAVVPLDEAGRVLLIGQYRHAVGRALWELPAGLLDVPGEDPQLAAERELAEETGLRAAQWRQLVEFYPSPGYSNELVRVFLARELTEVPAEQRGPRHHEESALTYHWVSLADALAMVQARQIVNGSTVVGLLAAYADQLA
jgi:ADP-ribose pyrophosphatase